MSVLLEKDVKSVTIEYLPTEKELDKEAVLVVGQGLTDNINITEVLGTRMFFGVKRYITGLDPELVKYDNSLSEEQKQAKITEIQATIQRLEQFFGPGSLEATNEKFWKDVYLVLKSKTTNLDLNTPKNEILVRCIKAGGFNEVAPTLEEAIASSGKSKFYLIEPVEFIENRVSPRKQYNKAIGMLSKMDDSKTYDDLFFLAKYILPAEKAYTKSTPKSLLYEDLDKYIKGEIVRDSKTDLASRFIEATKVEKKKMIVFCLLKDAVYYNMLYRTEAGELKNNETGGIYGTTLDKAVDHLLHPAYSHELENIKVRIEEKWSM